jgi:UDP-N-acetylmuramate--alanine ligase
MTYIMMKAMLDPTVMVGGNLDIIDGNFRMGNSGYFVTETCEYCRSFLKFFPRFAIILNVEEDHLDYYRDLDDIIDAFTDFAAIVPEDGYVVVPNQSDNAMRCLGKVRGNVLTFGTADADFTAENIRYTDYGYPVFDVVYNGEVIVSVELSVPGEHNVLNATACIACAYAMGIDMKYVKEGLEAFTGTKRRFEKKGFVNGALVIDDYAHHPTEIKATLDAVARVKHNRLWCIFQPHTYTRTYSLFDDFVSVLGEAENVIVADIYAAREVDTGIVSAAQLAEKISGARFMKNFEDIEDYIRQNASEGDIVLTVGAGNVVDIADSLVK